MVVFSWTGSSSAAAPGGTSSEGEEDVESVEDDCRKAQDHELLSFSFPADRRPRGIDKPPLVGLHGPRRACVLVHVCCVGTTKESTVARRAVASMAISSHLCHRKEDVLRLVPAIIVFVCLCVLTAIAFGNLSSK